ncbi:MAG: hypothetical protein LBC26_06710 [Oscillospiraceae bacterium]|jgi:hypothetical protein|nr:hypothetical protein [Oscillospiraceae bacterium]
MGMKMYQITIQPGEGAIYHHTGVYKSRYAALEEGRRNGEVVGTADVTDAHPIHVLGLKQDLIAAGYAEYLAHAISGLVATYYDGAR